MSTTELREKIYKKLKSVDDYLLEEILGLIELEGSKKRLLKIPEDHKIDIEIGLAQLEQGQTLHNDEVNKSVKEWLGR